MKPLLSFAAAGLAAGTVTGILGSGGGLVLVPLLRLLNKEDSKAVFPYSLSIMLPICLVSLLLQWGQSAVSIQETVPYLIGGTLGGIGALILSMRISPKWLHRLFGCILLWSGFRCLFC